MAMYPVTTQKIPLFFVTQKTKDVHKALSLKEELGFDPKPSIAVLNNAAGFLRGALGKSLQVRMIPRLRFHYDETIVRGNRMAELIHQAISEDEVAQQNNLELIEGAVREHDEQDLDADDIN